MKRDLELIRKILLHFEDDEEIKLINYQDILDQKKIQIEGYDGGTIVEHLNLLFEANYINGEPEVSKTGRLYAVHPFRLTWEGHEFLDATRNESLFKKAMAISRKKSLNLPVDIFKSLMLKLISGELNL
jgi:hypothetical protein